MGVRNRKKADLTEHSAERPLVVLPSPPGHMQLPREGGRGTGSQLGPVLNADPTAWPVSGCMLKCGGVWSGEGAEGTLERLFFLFLDTASPRDGAQVLGQVCLTATPSGLGTAP